MNKGHTQEYRVGVGASSILMIFIVLCLTTLGVLSFASSRANLNLTTKRVERVEAYYTACAKAQALLAKIDEALLTARETPDEYQDAVRALGDIDPAIQVSRGKTIYIRLPVGETQELRLDASIGEIDAAERYTLLSYSLVSIEKWEPDTSLDVFK